MTRSLGSLRSASAMRSNITPRLASSQADCRKLSTHDFFQQLQNAVHAVELVLVEGPHRKIRSETILECEDNRNNIDRCKAPICQQRIVIRKRIPITLALKDML